MLPRVLALLACAAAAAAQQAPLRRVAVDLERHSSFAWHAHDVVAPPRAGAARVELLADDRELSRLAAAGVAWTVLEPDQQAAYAARLVPGGAPVAAGTGAWVDPPFAGGSIGGYYSLAEIGAVLDQVAAAFPQIATPKQSLGLSHEGRPIWMLEVSDHPGIDEGEPGARFDALHHAREPASMQAVLWFLLWLVEGYGSDPLATYLVDERRLYFAPCANPDGYVFNEVTAPAGGGLWRKNRRPLGGGLFGVDLNRNYPSFWGADDVGSSPDPASDTYRGPAAGSEPEVQALLAFLAQRELATAVTAHAFGDLWLHPYSWTAATTSSEAWYQELGALITAQNHYAYGPSGASLYLANGVITDHDHAAHGTFSWTAEIGDEFDGFWPPTERIVPLAEENLLALQRVALAAGAFVHATAFAVHEVGDGDGWHEPGEAVAIALTARNSGRAATAGPVSAALIAGGPGVTVIDGIHSFGALAPLAEASTGATPLLLHLAPGTPTPATASFVVRLAYEGFVQEVAGTLPLGPALPYALDDVEEDLGWVAGAPGDGAWDGFWERGDPAGTSLSGEAAHPSKDASQQPAKECWSTGNAGGAAGTDDVDGGPVSLTTPRIDLSDVGPAVVRYARWVADLGVEDDVFSAWISNDDGATWTLLEEVHGNANAWTEVAFLVPEKVAQTASVRLRFVADDTPNNSVVEAAIDELRIDVHDPRPRMNVLGATALGADVALHVSGAPGAAFATFASLATGSFVVPGLAGAGLLSPSAAIGLLSGQVPTSGLFRAVVAIPAVPSTAGVTLHLQSVVLGAAPAFTNRATITLL